MFDQTHEEAYFSSTRPWEGSLLCRKDIINEDLKYGNLPRGEDTFFILKLLQKKYLFPLVMPILYIYIYHGMNTWNWDHWRYLLSLCQKLPVSVSKLIADILRGRYSYSMASELLSEGTIQSELDYFHSFK
jgi:hypothetical protein